MISNQQLDAIGDRLYEAWQARMPLDPPSATHALTIDDAYRIQQRMVARRIGQGETVIGKKIGVTSKAVQDMLDVRQPDFGILLSGMAYADGAAIPIDTLIQPRAEGEIAFFLKERLQGPGVTAQQVLAATRSVAACFEIVDSRVQDWRIRIADTVADNASCGVFAIGAERVSPQGLDLAGCAMTIEKNGEAVATGIGAAALGHPAEAVAWLANELGRRGIALEAGEPILSGSLAVLVPVKAGDALSVRIEGIGACAVSFV
ncbi:fumarylacetoacetate hydrolase family protein [Pseudoduganella ginsengisoli]|uniref:2-oxopent-4-enoate hydratase n=1 Tax=Pseudoduganella ginsengisoli TaxID=1462440 RepID=A0A6L6PWK9_9BURK|nr:fumarylacetoacetate hydrolase family protein [Pseudoduganella ginsengisoli]MTW01619.1 2-oxopent-4-enoate hydratase [Pseudoduganella ginsengisoli]